MTTKVSRAEASMYDHYRPTDNTVEDAIYRVVGTTDDSVTLLAVANEDGNRRYTGRILTVDRSALSNFEPAENPDANPPFEARLLSMLDGFRLNLGQFVRSLAARPIPTAFALVLIVIAEFGGIFFDLPNLIRGIAMIVGYLYLIYVGTRGLTSDDP